MLQVLLIGTPQFNYLKQKLEVKGKPAALLALIAAHHPLVLPRELAERYLWGRSAAQNLRQAIYTLRQLPYAKDWLVAEEQLSLKHLEVLTTDNNQELMQGMEGLLSDEGLEWLGLEREKIRSYQRQKVFQAAQASQGQDQIILLEQLLCLDPLHESAAQMLIRAHLEQQNQVAAQEVFTQLRLVLQRELGAEPLPATKALLLQSEQKNQPDFQRFKRAYAVAGQLDTQLIAQMLEADELEVAEILTQLEALDPISIKQTTPKPIWQLLQRRAAQLLETKNPERAANHWLEAGEDTLGAKLLLDCIETALKSKPPIALKWFRQLESLVLSFESQLRLLELQQRFAELRSDVALLEKTAQQFFTLAREQQNDSAEYLAYCARTSWQIRSNQSRQALKTLEDATRAAKRLQDNTKLEQLELLRGTAHLMLGEFELALQALSPLQNAQVENLRLVANSNLGAIYGLQSQLAQALECFEHALQLARASKNLIISARVVQNLAVTAEKLERFERAIESWYEAIEIAQQLEDHSSVSLAYANLSLTRLKMGQLGIAWNTAEETLEFSKDTLAAQFLALSVKAGVLRHLGLYSKALTFENQAQEVAMMSQNPRLQADAAANLALTKWLIVPETEQDFLSCLKPPVTASVIEELQLEYGLHSNSSQKIRQVIPKPSGQPRSNQIHTIISARLALLEQQTFDQTQLIKVLELPFLETTLGYLVLIEWRQRQGFDTTNIQTQYLNLQTAQRQALPKEILREVQALTLN